MKLNIVVVNYNNSECTLGLCKSLLDSQSYINELVIVDNNSSIVEVDLLRSLKEDKIGFAIRIIELNQNVGYFPALNVGLDTLPSKKNIQTIIGNNDLLFTKTFFENLQQLYLEENVYAIAPSIKTIDDVYQNPAQINKPSMFKRLFYRLYYSNYIVGSFILLLWNYLGLSAESKKTKDIVSKPIYIGMGAIYILQPVFFESESKLEYPLFLYGEEAFLSKQIEEANGVVFYEPSLEVIHLESVATAKLPKKSKYLLMKRAYSIFKEFMK